MKTRIPLKDHGIFRIAILAALTFPTIAMAHPGHFHPGEEDEFDALRANFLHLHGTLEISLAILALASAAIFMIHKNRRIRAAAACAFGGSLALIAAF